MIQNYDYRMNWPCLISVALILMVVSSSTADDNPAPSSAHPAPDETILPAPRAEEKVAGAPDGKSQDAAGQFWSPAGGMGGIGGAWEPTLGNAAPRVNYGIVWYPNEAVKGQNAELGFVRQDLNVAVPLWQCPTDEWTLSAGVREETFDTSAILPFSRQHFPDELWNINFGAGYRHLFESGWVAGVNMRVGSASDKPFENFEQVTASVSGLLRIPVRDQDALILTLAVSNNTDFLNGIPIPGVAYFFHASDCFQALIGFPFCQMLYRPADDVALSLSYRFLYSIDARATYFLRPRWQFYVGYSTNDESYFLAENASDEDRLFYFEQRVYTGVGFRLARWASVDLSGGFAFDRSYSEGRNFQANDQHLFDLGAGPFLSLMGHFRF